MDNLRRIAFLILLLLALSVSAAAQQTIFVPVCTGVAATDTARFNTIKTTIGSVNPATIRLPRKANTAQRCKVNDLTLTANITLDNSDGSGIFIVTAKTLTVVGPIVAPPIQIFYNALAGQGTISFAGNRVIPEYYAEWWGAKGDNLDASVSANNTAWQAALDATQSQDAVIFRLPLNAVYRVNSTLTVTDRHSLLITSGLSRVSDLAPGFRWTGTGGKMFVINRSFYVKFQGLAVDLASGATIDKFFETNSAGGFNGGHIWSGMLLNASSQANDSFIGIDINPGAASNNENFLVENSQINGSNDFVRQINRYPSGRNAPDGQMTNGGTTLTVPSYTFPSDIAGKIIRVGLVGAAGTYGRQTLVTTVASRTSDHVVELAAPAQATVTNALVHTGQSRGIGVNINGDGNAKHNVIRDSGIGYCATGVKIRGGSINLYNIGTGVNLVGVDFLGGMSEPAVFHQLNWEANYIELQGKVSNDNPVLISNSRGDNLAQPQDTFYLLEGVIKFDTARTEGPPPPGGRIFQGGLTSGLQLRADDFTFHNSLPDEDGTISVQQAGFDTFSFSDSVNPASTIYGLKGWNNAANNGSGPIVFSGNTGAASAGYRAADARASARDVAVVVGPTVVSDDPTGMGTAYHLAGALSLGGGLLDFGGLHVPATPKVIVIGALGAVTRRFRIVARDAVGNRVVSFDPSNLQGYTTVCPTTLSGSNFLRITFPAQYPAATDYQLLEVNPSDITQARIVATITPSGTDFETYDLTANPAGAYTAAAIPSRNETASVYLQAPLVQPYEVAFTSLDATPSVAQSNDFVTANAGATSITTFDDGITGQIIRVRVNDANTTFVNGGTLVTGTGADIVATNGYIYSFILRGSAWRRIQ